MEIKEAQEKIREFDKARGWDNHWNLKDLSLNIVEEVGELWSLIKWVNDETQKEIVGKKKGEVENFVGDTLFLVLKIANQAGVDAHRGLSDVLEEYEKRMPAEKMREVKHANKLAGGVDNKDG